MNARFRLLSVLGGSLLLLFWASGSAAAETLLVVSFENTARTDDLGWVGESFAETLTERLGSSGHRLVSREERLAARERLGLPATAPLTHASLLRLGEEAEADRIVLGRFEVEDGQLRGQARLLDLHSLSLSPFIEEQGAFSRLRQVQGRLAGKILRRLDPSFPFSPQAFDDRFPRLRVSAFESYVRGLLALNREQQRRYFLQAARLEPHYSRPAFRLAQLYFEDQDYATAAAWFRKIPPDDFLALDARFYLALCQFFRRDFAGATDTLAPLAERRPAKPVWNNLGVFASRQGASQAVVGYFARALEADPADADVYFNLGLHHLRRAEWDQAARALEQCLELNPGDTEARFLFARALERLGRVEDAQRARQQAVGDSPASDLSQERRPLELDRLELHFNARLVQLNQADNVEPAPTSARALHVAIHVERGQDLFTRGALESAQREFTQAILLDPDAYLAHFFLAEIYQRQGRLQEAISELKASLWSQESVRARLRLAEIYLKQNHLPQARQQVQAALALEPDNAAARALAARLPARTAETRAEDTDPE
ncbi:MAG: tetratricopeptide repeat protein [Terriglobia bacterium]